MDYLSGIISFAPSESWGFLKGGLVPPFEAASVSPETLAASSGYGLPPENGVWGHAPPSAFGRAAASPQTRQMRCWPSSERTTNPSSRRKRQDSLSLSLVLFPPKPLRWVSAGTLLGAVIKLPCYIFYISVWGVSLTLRLLWLCRNNPARGLFRQKKRLSQSGCSAPTDTLFPPAHSAFSALLCGGVVSLPSACASCR